MKIYKTLIINKLNNYNWSDEEIEKVKQYLLNGILPDRNKKRFIEKFKDFEIRNNKIFFTPLNLEVIPNNKKQETLKYFYDSLQSIGNGKVNFYKKIIDKYLNIKRKDTDAFIDKQAVHQINTESKHIINKPILASSCGERVAVDLVSVDNLEEFNKHNNFILTAIDYFSRKVWARPLKNKESETVRKGLESIFNEMTFTPHILQSDNGSEFKNYESIAWLKEQKIKPIFSLSYSPESNGLIENFNRQLRKMMREIFIRNNNLNWLDYLQNIIDSKNETYNSTIKAKPNLIWNPENFYNNVKNRQQNQEPIEEVNEDNANPETIRKEITNNIKDKARKQILKNKIIELNVGDWVRVKMSAIFSELRRAIKQDNKKLINVTYTPEIYRIFKIIDESKPGLEKKRYTLKNIDGTPLYTESKINEMRHTHRYKRLFASDLLKIDKDTDYNNINYDNDRANQLNQIHKLVIDKPITEKINRPPREKPINEEPQEIRRSTRIRKENKNDDYIY
jgi:hypothetical protein